MSKTSEVKRELGDVGEVAEVKRGGNTMSKRQEARSQKPEARNVVAEFTRRAVTALAVAAMMVLGVGVVGKVEAASTDTIVLLVTPGTNLSVKLSSPTPNIGWDFGTVTLGNSTISSSGTVVENDGSVSAKLMLRGDSLDTWTLANSSTSLPQDQACILAVFTSTNVTQVTESTFGVNSNSYVQEDTNREAVAGSVYATSTDYASPVNPIGTDRRNLWFRMTLPATSSVATQQRFRIYVVAAMP